MERSFSGGGEDASARNSTEQKREGGQRLKYQKSPLYVPQFQGGGGEGNRMKRTPEEGRRLHAGGVQLPRRKGNAHNLFNERARKKTSQSDGAGGENRSRNPPQVGVETAGGKLTKSLIGREGGFPLLNEKGREKEPDKCES